MRLRNYLKVYGGYTATELTKLNSENRILVNNEVKNFLYIVCDNDIITVDKKEIKPFAFSYFLYNKPRGILSDIKDVECSYINQINLPFKVVPCGRLDKDSQGLMLLTNDGKLVDLVMGKDTHFEKEYIVTLDKIITDEFLINIQKPHNLSGRITKPIKAKKIDDYTVSLILNEGAYHQIRKIVILNGNRVNTLTRIRISTLLLGDLLPGEIKEITKEDIK